ncbi:MAG TPA: hypothetical protein VEA78_11120 [Acidimicrobiales bacterium]|nr:hypothetical protein [Acidimicrobiales bacterium]
MRRDRARWYAPFVALAIVQAAFVVFAPRDDAAPVTGAPTVGGPAAVVVADGGVLPVSTVPGVHRSTPTFVVEGGAAAGGASPTSDVAAAGDVAHCAQGRQTDVLYSAPPCVPRFEGDNGGATYKGVTANEIRVVAFECQTDEQVGALLAAQGMVSTGEQRDEILQAVVQFVNERYETYGRTVVLERIVGDCPTTPPDPVRSRQAALEVAKTEPAFVFANGGGVEAVEVFAEHGIVTLGLLWQRNEHYADRRPFRWDVFPSGTETASWVAEHYCKKLAGRPATHAGRLIHPSIGDRSTVRKLGVIVPDDGTGTTVPTAEQLARDVEACSGVPAPVVTYQSDIGRALEQAHSGVARLIDEGVTTVACMCDAIAPVFLTQAMTQNGYHPEHLVTGMGLTDDDALARMYDPAQWRHAFGLSQVTEPVPLAETDAARVWRAVGNEGTPCGSCTLLADYILLIGSMIHLAGPHLDPGTVERGLVGSGYARGGWAETGGDPHVYLTRFGAHDYNAMSDVREVWWDPSATSAKDGQRGAYVSLAGGRRYALGQLTAAFDAPPASS